MSHRLLGIVAGAMLIAMTPVAHATDVVIDQQNKEFSQKSISIKVGDSVKFVNKDDMVHDVHSTSDGYDFDLGAQKPGSEASYTFDKPGKVKVRCA
ncbi:MAG: cupredoxin domain-containing protein, partial [Vicinamibacterales bacterium]